MSRPSGRSRSSIRGGIQRTISQAHQRLLAQTRALSQADSPMLRQAGAVLSKHIKRQLNTRATGMRTAVKTDARGRRRVYGEPSAPGEAPRKLTGALQRGIRNKVVEGERQVRAEHFTSKILELGAVSPARPARTITRGRRKGQTRGATGPRVLEPRPFMRPGLESARPELATVGAQVLRDGVRQAFAQRAGGLGA